MTLKLLNKIDKTTKYSVYGWIREKEKTLRLSSIPSGIIAMCILYCRDDEIFHVRNERKISLSVNSKSITKIGNANTNIGWNNNTYGIIEIPSMNNMTYQWDIKIVKVLSRISIIIGIASNNIPDEFIGQSCKSGIYYAFWSHGNKGAHNIPITIYGDAFGTNDIISICLDLQKAQIRFSINQNMQKIAFRNIVKSEKVKYRLFVSMWYVGESVEITNFFKR